MGAPVSLGAPPQAVLHTVTWPEELSGPLQVSKRSPLTTASLQLYPFAVIL